MIALNLIQNRIHVRKARVVMVNAMSNQEKLYVVAQGITNSMQLRKNVSVSIFQVKIY